MAESNYNKAEYVGANNSLPNGWGFSYDSNSLPNGWLFVYDSNSLPNGWVFVYDSNSLPNGWVFVNELSGCGFESRCSQSFATVKRKE